MLEGHWTVRFVEPDSPDFDLNGGTIVIESSRIMGGDSGYSYDGTIALPENGQWPVNIVATRHDKNIISIFGDLDRFSLSGNFNLTGTTVDSAPILRADLSAQLQGSPRLVAELTKIAELP